MWMTKDTAVPGFHGPKMSMLTTVFSWNMEVRFNAGRQELVDGDLLMLVISHY